MEGRSSIADLCRPKQRCGIYLLRFSDGAVYCGQAIDVSRRFVQHRHTSDRSDSTMLAFKVTARSQLDTEEQRVIAALDCARVPHRNITYASVVTGDRDFDLIMSRELQERWLSDLHFVDQEGERVVDPALRERY